LNGREKVVEKNGPFSLTFCQIVALMLPHRSVFAGCLFVVILFPPMKGAKSKSIVEVGYIIHPPIRARWHI
jgi:hypothetical protein